MRESRTPGSVEGLPSQGGSLLDLYIGVRKGTEPFEKILSRFVGVLELLPIWIKLWKLKKVLPCSLMGKMLI